MPGEELQSQLNEVFEHMLDMDRVKHYCEILNRLQTTLSPMNAEQLQCEANDLLSLHRSRYYIFYNYQIELYEYHKR